MTIEDAIIRFEKIAEKNEEFTRRFNGIGGKAVAKCCDDCAEIASEHRQLVGWLLELKDLRSEQNDESVFIRELMDELAETKRLLGLAVDGLNRKMPCNNDAYAPNSCDICMKQGNCDYANSFSWKHTNEAEKLLKEE